jgi:hypothetical protein
MVVGQVISTQLEGDGSLVSDGSHLGPPKTTFKVRAVGGKPACGRQGLPA